MGRTREPTKVHELKGSYKKNPQRKPQGEPEPKEGIGPAPEHLDEYEKQVWDELVDSVCPGVLGDSDRIAVERAVKLLVLSRRDPENFKPSHEGQLRGYLASFGMTPSDRAKVQVSDGGNKNPFEGF